MPKICAVLTCYNRKDSTLECLQLLESSAKQATVDLAAVLVDDGSNDGTADAVLANFNWVKVVHGDGTLYWNRGMHLGMEIAMAQNSDFILWINDDTHLYPDAIGKLLTTYDEGSKKNIMPVIVVGATADKMTGNLTYGGLVTTSIFRPFTFHRVWSETIAVECEAMNGNLVLIPKEIVNIVGNLDPAFEHALGDIDFAFRAKNAGYSLLVTPGFVGDCSHNPVTGTYLDASLPLGVRWTKMMSRKGLPIQSWLRFTSKHGGLFWPLYFVWPYLKLLIMGSMRFFCYGKNT